MALRIGAETFPAQDVGIERWLRAVELDERGTDAVRIGSVVQFDTFWYRIAGISKRYRARADSGAVVLLETCEKPIKVKIVNPTRASASEVEILGRLLHGDWVRPRNAAAADDLKETKRAAGLLWRLEKRGLVEHMQRDAGDRRAGKTRLYRITETGRKAANK